MIQSCKKPADLLKFGHHGKPKWRKFFLTYSTVTRHWYLEWSSRDKTKDTKLNLQNVTQITLGQKTPKFERLSRRDVTDKSFSIWYEVGEKRDTLDLVAETESMFLQWTTSIRALVKNKVPPHVMELVKRDVSALDMSEPGMKSIGLMSSMVTKPQQQLKGKKKYEAALETTNVVYGFGLNTWGQLSGKNREEKAPLLLHMNTGENPTEIAGGWSHTIMLMSDGGVEAMGHRMGTGLEEDETYPKSIKYTSAGNIDSIACGRSHNCLLTENGDVYTWGCNFFGQLGHGDNKDRNEPTFVQNILEAKAQVEISEIACGSDFTVALSHTCVFSWGSGKKGALGHGDEKDRFLPTKVDGVKNPTGIACGAHHAIVWSKSNRSMYSWGNNGSGQLGLGHTDTVLKPSLIESLNGQTTLCAGAGGAHTIVVTFEDGSKSSKTWSFGSNSRGQIAQGSTGEGAKVLVPTHVKDLDKIQEVACGSMHTLARSEDGGVWASGCNHFGQLGMDGKDYLNRFTLITSLKDKNPRSIACGAVHSFVMCPKKWLKDEEVDKCMKCNVLFTFINRRHHCRNCCGIFCNKCSNKRIAILSLKLKTPQRVCDACYAQLRARAR